MHCVVRGRNCLLGVFCLWSGNYNWDGMTAVSMLNSHRPQSPNLHFPSFDAHLLLASDMSKGNSVGLSMDDRLSEEIPWPVFPFC